MELSYSFHLTNDKNKTARAKEQAKKNNSNTTSYSNNAIQNLQQLSKADKHNLKAIIRTYIINTEFDEVESLTYEAIGSYKLGLAPVINHLISGLNNGDLTEEDGMKLFKMYASM